MALKDEQVNTIANAIKELLGVGVEVLAENLAAKTKKDKENTETDEHKENSQDDTTTDQDD